MNADLIIIAPVFDEVTKITYDESRDVFHHAVRHNLSICDLTHDQAIREKVEEAFKENPEALVYHADHGSDDAIWGNDERPVIDLFNVGILKDREIDNNNCSSAKVLGVEAWKKGCITFCGSTDVVSFTTDALTAFKEAFTFRIKKRIDYLVSNETFTWEQIVEDAKELMTNLADKLVDEKKVLAAACMRQNRDILVCYTKDSPPQSNCVIRKTLIKIFGPKAWYIPNIFHRIRHALTNAVVHVNMHKNV